VRIDQNNVKGITTRVPAQDYLLWRSRGDVFETMAAHLRDDVTFTGAGEPHLESRDRRSAPGTENRVTWQAECLPTDV
jgi:hypothetical protein